MNDTLLFLAHVPTEALNQGFLPAAKSLGKRVILLTDQASAHHHYFSQPDLPAYPEQIVQCDVFNPVSVLDAVSALPTPVGVFSNSDHLQTVTALTAAYLDLPGKDWRHCYRAKNKAAMRQYLMASDEDACWFQTVSNPESLARVAHEIPYPCIAKPREGVGSLNVRRLENAEQLLSFGDWFWQRHPGQPLLLEEYLPGPVHTLETLGDGTNLIAIGGFEVSLSEPPHFVELEASWVPYTANSPTHRQMLEQVRRFGTAFGSCHSEFALTPPGPRLIDINYRTVGDGRDFLLDRMMDHQLFKTILTLHLGQPLDITAPRSAAHVRYLGAPKSGTVRRAPAARTEPCGDGWVEFAPLKSDGDQVRITHSNKDYLGVLRLFASDRAQLEDMLTAWTANLETEWEIG